MFSDRLQQIRDRIEGARLLSLVARDGMPVETVPTPAEYDVDLLAAELMSQVRAVAQNHQELDVGAVHHLSVSTERATLMVSAVAAGYYLLLVLAPDANHGRARFELRRAVLGFEEDLI